MSETVRAFCDGAAIGNPGPGGWAVVLDGVIHSDNVGHATNNEMELRAVVEAALHAPGGVRLEIYTDSRVVLGWLRHMKTLPSLQIARLARTFFEVVRTKHLEVEFHWTKGHGASGPHEQAHRAAKAQARTAWNALHSS